jgi:multisubunit Na+/H+ antiporter MnhB subunit
MYVTAMFIITVIIIYFGILFSKKNFERGIEKITHFKLRYTFLLLVLLGYSAYVDTLPPTDKQVKVAQVKALISTANTHIKNVVSDGYSWLLVAAKK